MANAKEFDHRGSGMKLRTRFALFMTLSLLVVMSVFGFLLYKSAAKVAGRIQGRTLEEAVLISAENARRISRRDVLRGERQALEWLEQQLPDSDSQDIIVLREDIRSRKNKVDADRDQLSKPEATSWTPKGETAMSVGGSGQVLRQEIEYGDGKPGHVYRFRESPAPGAYVFDLLAPEKVSEAQSGLLGLIFAASTLVILVGLGTAIFVATQVAGPIEQIVKDVREISAGHLRHRVRATGTGEVKMLAKSIDRMTQSLTEAQDAELELSIRQREVEVAGEVREALMPSSTPKVEGYDFGAVQMSSEELEGDFYDYIELPDGKVGVLVCDVSGKGIPGSLVGATARSYLRAELSRGNDVTEAFFKINRQLAPDVRRGMFVSAMYALLDPGTHTATIVCAGHKVPLVRYCASDKKVRLVHPEGIALGFDKGPIFERSLVIQEVALEPGDRLVISNTGPVVLQNANEEEFGEKRLYAHIMKFAGGSTPEFIDRMRKTFERFSGEAELAKDLDLVTLARS